MEGQDILDINGKLLGEVIPPIGKRMLLLREQAILKGSTGPSKLDVKPGAGMQSPPTGNSSEEITSTPASSTSGEQTSSSEIATSSAGEEEI
ncbi:hypothetical protein SK128_022999, partial [Halocaridina rubra]